jgi:hypothetical protein
MNRSTHCEPITPDEIAICDYITNTLQLDVLLIRTVECPDYTATSINVGSHRYYNSPLYYTDLNATLLKDAATILPDHVIYGASASRAWFTFKYTNQQPPAAWRWDHPARLFDKIARMISNNLILATVAEPNTKIILDAPTVTIRISYTEHNFIVEYVKADGDRAGAKTITLPICHLAYTYLRTKFSSLTKQINDNKINIAVHNDMLELQQLTNNFTL